MKRLISILFIGLLAACTANDPFKKLDKLSGLWQANNSEADLYEEWSKSKNGKMYGKSYVLNGADSMIFERVELKKEKNEVIYAASVNGQNNGEATAFRLISYNDSTFTFENKAHDFPQRVIYRFVGNDSLVARVEGNHKGEDQAEEVYYRRVRNYSPK